MSTAAISSSITPPGELALSARVREIQTLIEQAEAGATGARTAAAASANSSSDFASALQQASTTASAASVDYQGESASAGGEYEALIDQAAQRNGIEPALLHGLIQQESGFDPSSQSSAGAMGLTQLMPGTASTLGVSNPFDPAESIEGGARYLSGLLSKFGGNTSEALAAYNAGPSAVSEYGGVPPYAETESYVAKVLANAQAYRVSHPSDALTGALT